MTEPRPQWTPDRVTLLKTLWTAGLSGAAIEIRLGCIFTRNAIIGKVHRLKLPRRTNALPRVRSRKPEKIRSRAPSKPSLRPNPIPKAVIAPLTAPASLGVFIEHVKGCKHGIGFQDGKHTFCDSFPLWNNSAYCHFHYELNHRADGRL